MVIVASERPLYLSQELLCTRSQYFQTALQGGFSESRERTVAVPWEDNKENCVLFLSWLGSMTHSGSDFTSDCMLLFLRCCAYFQVIEEYWVLVQQRIQLPSSYNSLAETTKDIWTRQAIPFPIMEKLVESVQDKLERLAFILAWFNEKTATSPSEKQDLETCSDFFLIRKLASTTLTFPRRVQQHYGPFGGPAAYGQPQVLYAPLAAAITRFPVAANCLESAWLLTLVQEIMQATTSAS